MYTIGIDQTGAVDVLKQPKPLPTCMIRGNCLDFFYLRAVSLNALNKCIQVHSPEVDIQIAIDCVFGVPSKVGVPFRTVLRKTLQMEGWGRQTANAFFTSLSPGQFSQRRVEVLTGAQSVFQTVPFQRNVQTGSFRIWKELAQEEGWFYFPYLDERPSKGLVPIYEAYPTLSWKKLFGLKVRKPEFLESLVKSHYPHINFAPHSLAAVKKDANFADAAVIALHLHEHSHTEPRYPTHPEGWILGASERKGET